VQNLVPYLESGSNFGNKNLRRLFGSKVDEVTEEEERFIQGIGSFIVLICKLLLVFKLKMCVYRVRAKLRTYLRLRDMCSLQVQDTRCRRIGP
jgi:hypothetical protein